MFIHIKDRYLIETDKEQKEWKEGRKKKGRRKEKKQFDLRCMTDFSEGQTSIYQQFIIFEAKDIDRYKFK